jgi:hypothetical protein
VFVKGTKNAMQHNWVLFLSLLNAIKKLPKHLNGLHEAMQKCRDEREIARVIPAEPPSRKLYNYFEQSY